MKKLILVIGITGSLLLSSAIPASADNSQRTNEGTTMTSNNYRTNATSDDDGFDWGWLGLLGLLGLAGSRNRQRDRDRA